MSKHNVWYFCTEYGTVFWNSEGFIHYIQENDATWRAEYFNPIMNYLNVEVKYYDVDKLPKWGDEDENDIIPKWVDEYVKEMERGA